MRRTSLVLVAAMLVCGYGASAQVVYGPAAITGGTIKNTNISGSVVTDALVTPSGGILTTLGAALARSGIQSVAQRTPSSNDDDAHGYTLNSIWQYGGTVWKPFALTPNGHAFWTQAFAGQGAAPLPGDATATPTWATYCSTRLQIAAYGPSAAIDVQYVNAGTVTTINFLPDGSLDYATLDKTSAAAGALPRVIKCYDQSGSANHITAAFATAPTILPSSQCGQGGDRSIVFDSFIDNWPQAVVTSGTPNVLRFMSIPAGVAPNVGAYSAIWFGRANAAIRPLGYFQLTGANSLAITSNVTGLSNAGNLAFSSVGSGLAQIPGLPPMTTPEFLAVSRVSSLTNLQYGEVALTTTQGASGTLAGGYMGAVDYPAGQISTNGRGSYAGMQEVCAFGVAGRGFTQAELATERQAMIGSFKTTPQVKDQYFALGDSIEQGTGSTGLQNHSRQLDPLLVTPAEIHNAAWHGSTLAQQVGYYTSFIRPFINPKAPRRTLNIQGGRNDFASNNQTSAQVYASLQSLMALVAADGWTNVCLNTILPEYAATAPQIAQEVAYSALVRANYRTLGANCLIDRANMVPFQSNNPLLFSDIGLHPTTLGYGLIAMESALNINPLLGAE